MGVRRSTARTSTNSVTKCINGVLYTLYHADTYQPKHKLYSAMKKIEKGTIKGDIPISKIGGSSYWFNLENDGSLTFGGWIPKNNKYNYI